MRKKITVLTMATLLILTSFVLMLNIGNDDNDVSGQGTGTVDFCEFNPYGLGSHYVGDTVEFYIRINNIYNGQLWENETGHYTSDSLFNCRLVITDEVFNSDDEEVDIYRETETGSMDVYNGENGFNFTGGRYYYSEENPDILFSFDIDRLNIVEDTYRIKVRALFDIRTDFNSEAPDGFDYEMKSQEGFLEFNVNSNIEGVSREAMEIMPYEDGVNIPLYSGAKYITLKETSLSSFYGRMLEDFTATIDLPDNQFTLEKPSYTLTELAYSNTDLIWKVDIPDYAEPGTYEGDIRFEYSIEFTQYSEGPYPIEVDIAPTPLVVPESTQGMTEPTITIQQKTDSSDFSVDITNGGNIDLEKVTVMLDLDSAKYLKQSDFYFDEDNMARKVYSPLEFTYENLLPGETFTAEFSNVGIEGMLPPGDYLIPMDYRLSYLDPFASGDNRVILYSYQMDEMGRNDYKQILYYREDPRATEVESPHIMMRVNDNPGGLDIKAKAENSLTSNVNNQRLDITVSNMELYPIESASINIKSSDPSMISAAGSGGSDLILYNEEGAVIFAATQQGLGIKTISTNVDVGNVQNDTECYLMIEGYNHMNKKVSLNISLPLTISPKPGDLSVVTMDTGKMKSDEDFQVMITIINSGNSPIEDYTVLLTSGSNMIMVKDPIQSGGDLAPGDTAEVSFTCHCSPYFEEGISVPMNIHSAFVDSDGNDLDFQDNGAYPVNVSSGYKEDKDELAPSVTGASVILLVAFIIAALLIGIAIVLAVILSKKEPTKKGKAKKEEDVEKEEEKEEEEEEEKGEEEKPPAPGPRQPGPPFPGPQGMPPRGPPQGPPQGMPPQGMQPQGQPPQQPQGPPQQQPPQPEPSQPPNQQNE